MRTILIFLLLGSILQADEFPTHTIKNDRLSLKVYLPNAEKGFYRGTRFDWSGVFTVEFKGHKLFGPWKANHDPKNNDDIVGPCEEFGSAFSSPLNYREAKVGERFLKIGVGELEKPKEDAYRFFHNYKIAKAGEWKVIKSDDKLIFTQGLHTDYGYAYSYIKILSVEGSEVQILHNLKNTGTKAISTDSYNHNFFNVDGDAVGKNYELILPFEAKVEKVSKDSNPVAIWKSKTLRFDGLLDQGSIYYELSGFNSKTGSADAAVTMRHKPTGIGVRVTGDLPPSRFNVWGIKTTLCPEPFVQLDLEPGKSLSWGWKYDFTLNAQQ
jgi:hypothetical protein